MQSVVRALLILMLSIPWKNAFVFRKGALHQHWRGTSKNLAEDDAHDHHKEIVAPALPSVWAAFGDLAAQTGATNLGQGFPDWSPPDFMIDSLNDAILHQPSHQYTRPAGHPQLVGVLAQQYSQFLDRYVDPMENVAITVGASQALYLVLMSLLHPGDEVVLFEPFFELYGKQVKLTGAVTKFVPLGKGPEVSETNPWALDIDTLKNCITEKTKLLILNSPHNPTGKVFTKKEMEMIAEVVEANPHVIVISDEVYKHTIYDPVEEGDSSVVGHYHFGRFPGMWNRTVTLSSCGKMFAATGWQVGWAVGPKHLIQPIHELLPCVQFCTSTPVQVALANALPLADLPYRGFSSYYEWMRCTFRTKRQILEAGLKAVGIQSIPSHGGYFLVGKLPDAKSTPTTPFTPTTPASIPLPGEPYDWTFMKKLAVEVGVVGLPVSPFISDHEGYPPMARFAFCKQDSTLESVRMKFISSLAVQDANSQNISILGI